MLRCCSQLLCLPQSQRLRNSPAHLHNVVTAPGYKPRLIDVWFADDPLTVERCKAGVPKLPGFCALVGPVTRDAGRVWHATHDLEMLPE